MKKLFALLMALVLVISAVPLMASATEDAAGPGEPGPGGCGDHSVRIYNSLGNGTHESKCVNCDHDTRVENCTIEGGKCTKCGYTAHECDFNGPVTSNHDGTHNINCSCGNKVTVKCSDGNGDRHCDSCNYMMYTHSCEWVLKETLSAPTCTKPGTGKYVCKVCGEVMGGSIPATGEHKWVLKKTLTAPTCGKNGTGLYACESCGTEMGGSIPATGEHKYEAGVTSNKNGTHNVNCKCGEAVTVKCSDGNGDRKCDSCGYEMYTHEHEWEVKKVYKKPTCGKTGTGLYVCKVCNAEMGGSIPATGEHKYEAGVTSNKNGTHNVKCVCGEAVTVKCADGNGDRKCDSCGYEMYTHEHEWEVKKVYQKPTCGKSGTGLYVCKVCDAEMGASIPATGEHKYEADVTSNENGTHNVNCECGAYVTVNCIDADGDLKCDSCGYQKYPECNHEGEQNLECNYDGTHNARCAGCKKLMAKDIPCVKQANGKCACGWDMNCKHEGAQRLTPNDDGKTHNAYCANINCNELMAKDIKCVKQADGKCACGRVMTGKPAVDPTLDKVPKTGDVLAPVALLSGLMSTVGLAVKKFFF